MKRPRPSADDHLRFFRGFLRKPQQVGSVIPSSRFLERRLVELAELGDVRTLVELGPGTGGTTRALLAALPADARLLAVELDRDFAARLAELGDPRLVVHRGSAGDLAAILAHHDLPAPDAVVSGIPFSTMERAVGRQIVAQIARLLAPGGRFVAYQVRGRVGELGSEVFGPPEVVHEPLNIPPVRIFRWRRPAAAMPPERRAATAGSTPTA
ncbi:MAG: methyltransferase domain-containing protein [Thermoanaerobaculia bacterium]|nr:methyltransferase domain-containing protein [Thermoanaerobaculia bacterium]